ncbi:MAG: hypothetical protein AAGD01_08595 [Acidobacteriota bacterium]
MELTPSQLIRAGDRQVPLPPGVTVLDWALERVSVQNPRIRAFLGSIKTLGSVLESNYAILHCSPERLLEIWRKVCIVREMIVAEIEPLLEQPSRIPNLETARQSARFSLKLLQRSVLEQLQRFPETITLEDDMVEVRKVLCVSIGAVHAFLQDAFGEIMAADPRSQHDADYFLSRRFPQDIEEAEWLHSTVHSLQEYLHAIDGLDDRLLSTAASGLRQRRMLPSGEAWERTEILLQEIAERITPKLKEVLALRGIRFNEMEILDRYADRLPVQARTVLELYAAGIEMTGRIQATAGLSPHERAQSAQDLLHCHGALGERIARRLQEMDEGLQDLVSFLPIWLQGIEKRRALMLKRLHRRDEMDEVLHDPFGTLES